MKLSKEQKEIAMTNISELWQEFKGCPICAGKKWSISNVVFELREFHGGSLNIGGLSKLCPVIPVHCTKCGNTLLLSPSKLGLELTPLREGGVKNG